MKTNFFPILVLALLTAGYLGFVIINADQLPQRAVIHFDGAGRANGWSDRQSAVRFFERLSVVPVVFVLLSLLMRIMPDSCFNLPHRDYWLAPVRRAETVGGVANFLIWMGCLMVLFFAGIFWLNIEANHTQPAHLPMQPFFVLVAGFLGLTGVGVFLLIRRFYHPPENTPS